MIFDLSKARFLTIKGCEIGTDIGSLTPMPDHLYRVELVRFWQDRSGKYQCIGRFMDLKDIEMSIDIGKTPYDPKNSEYDPRILYFREVNIVGLDPINDVNTIERLNSLGKVCTVFSFEKALKDKNAKNKLVPAKYIDAVISREDGTKYEQ